VHGPRRQAIVDAIANRPDGITRAELLDVVYADDIDGGPDNPNTIAVLIKFANAELATQGYRIESTWRGRGARYRLIEITAASSRSAMTMIDEFFHGYRAAEQRILSARKAAEIAPDDVTPVEGDLKGGPTS
jgi:hypothetical protein